MSLQPVLIIGLVLAALLYAVAALIYFRKGMRTKRWYALIGAALLSLASLGVGGVLLGGQWAFATIAILGGILNIISAMQWRPPTGQGIQH